MPDTLHDPLTLYCPACNAAFLALAHRRVCPRCSMPIGDDGAYSSPTLLMKTGEITDLHQANAAIRNDADELLQRLLGMSLDKYQIDVLLGRGGMGWVFLARHSQLMRNCALKILSPSLVRDDPEFLDRFRVEGQAAASLNHPNIVTTHDIGECDGMHFLEMEFVPGRSLQQIIREEPIDAIRATSIALGIAHGLAAAHRAGIVHRDVKPDNVLMTHNGIPKVGDFGLAKRMHSPAAGPLAGTPHYMAPELFQGETASPASDVYALGVCLFVMLTGRLPFVRPGINALIAAVTHESIPNIRQLRPGIPLEMAECVGALLEKSPANRPRDGIEVVQFLQAILGQARDVESLLHEALDDEAHVTWTAEGSRFRIEVALPHGRRQAVFVETTPHGVNDRLLQVFSRCGRAEPSFWQEALKLNSRISHGAIAIREIDGQEQFVVVNSYPRGTVDSEEIRRSVIDVAFHADAIENLLTGHDVH